MQSPRRTATTARSGSSTSIPNLGQVVADRPRLLEDNACIHDQRLDVPACSRIAPAVACPVVGGGSHLLPGRLGVVRVRVECPQKPSLEGVGRHVRRDLAPADHRTDRTAAPRAARRVPPCRSPEPPHGGRGRRRTAERRGSSSPTRRRFPGARTPDPPSAGCPGIGRPARTDESFPNTRSTSAVSTRGAISSSRAPDRDLDPIRGGGAKLGRCPGPRIGSSPGRASPAPPRRGPREARPVRTPPQAPARPVGPRSRAPPIPRSCTARRRRGTFRSPRRGPHRRPRGWEPSRAARTDTQDRPSPRRGGRRASSHRASRVRRSNRHPRLRSRRIRGWRSSRSCSRPL